MIKTLTKYTNEYGDYVCTDGEKVWDMETLDNVLWLHWETGEYKSDYETYDDFFEAYACEFLTDDSETYEYHIPED